MLDSFTEYKEAAVIFSRATEEPLPRSLPASKELILVGALEFLNRKQQNIYNENRSIETRHHLSYMNLHHLCRIMSTWSSFCRLLRQKT